MEKWMYYGVLLLYLISCGSVKKIGKCEREEQRRTEFVEDDSLHITQRREAWRNFLKNYRMQVEITEYDTSLPADSTTGKRPVSRRTVAQVAENSQLRELERDSIVVGQAVQNYSKNEEEIHVRTEGEKRRENSRGWMKWAAAVLLLIVIWRFYKLIKR